MKRLIFLAISSLLLASPLYAAPPVLNYVFPLGGQRGETVEMTANGSFATWPPEVWCDEPNVTVESQKQKGKLKLSIAKEAAPGVCWLRIADQEGASALCPFVIGELEETIDVEPNNDAAKPQHVKSTTINGRLEKRGDVDCFGLTLKKGETLTAALDANFRLGSPMDAVLQVVDTRGFIHRQDHDSRGLDPMLSFTAPADGNYVVRLFCFPAKPNSTVDFAGGDTYLYRLTITTGPYISHALPLAIQAGKSAEDELKGIAYSNGEEKLLSSEMQRESLRIWHAGAAGDGVVSVVDYPSILARAASQNEPLAISAPVVVSGSLGEAGDPQAFRFSAKKGDQRTIRVESRSLGFLLDAVVKIVDSTGKVLSETDDTSKQPDPVVSFTAPADGDYDIRIFDLYGEGGMRYAYRFTFAAPTPDFSLKLKTDTFTAKKGESVDVEVATNRTNKFGEPIEVTAIDLPTGWKAEAVVGENKSEAAKSVKLKLTAEKNAQSGPFRIVGKSGDREKTASFEIVGKNASHTQAWLTAQ